MSPTAIAGTTALVTGASRGFGRGIAAALSQAGARVIGVARDPEQLRQLRQLRSELGDSFIPVTADAAAPATAGQLVDAYQPAIVVLNAGAALRGSPLSGGYAGAKAASGPSVAVRGKPTVHTDRAGSTDARPAMSVDTATQRHTALQGRSGSG